VSQARDNNDHWYQPANPAEELAGHVNRNADAIVNCGDITFLVQPPAAERLAF